MRTHASFMLRSLLGAGDSFAGCRSATLYRDHGHTCPKRCSATSFDARELSSLLRMRLTHRGWYSMCQLLDAEQNSSRYARAKVLRTLVTDSKRCSTTRFDARELSLLLRMRLKHIGRYSMCQLLDAEQNSSRYARAKVAERARLACDVALKKRGWGGGESLRSL